MTPNEILQYYQTRELLIIDAIREIVDIESPSHDAERSGVVVGHVKELFAATGCEVDLERISSSDGTHLVIHAFAGDGPNTMILGHTDTVHPVGTNIKNPTRIDGDKFFGCGIFDMKSNIVLIAEALRYFAHTGTRPPGPLTIVLSCDEEVGSHSGRAIVEREAAKAVRCLIPEPSAEGRVKTGRKGTGQYKLAAHGVPAHAGLEPEKGANAVAELARQIDRIQSIARSEIGTTVNVCTFRGGTTSNVIPDLAECEIDVRFGSMGEGERVDSELRALTPIDGRVSLELIGEINRPPLERNAGVVALYEKARECAASFGYELGETQVGGASDGNFVAALGVPVLDGLGIAGSGAHRLDEHILVSDIANRATLITILLAFP